MTPVIIGTELSSTSPSHRSLCLAFQSFGVLKRGILKMHRYLSIYLVTHAHAYSQFAARLSFDLPSSSRTIVDLDSGEGYDYSPYDFHMLLLSLIVHYRSSSKFIRRRYARLRCGSRMVHLFINRRRHEMKLLSQGRPVSISPPMMIRGGSGRTGRQLDLDPPVQSRPVQSPSLVAAKKATLA